MTVQTDFSAITPSANAIEAFVNRETSITSYQSLVNLKLDELKVLLKLILQRHPSTGADAANYAAFNEALAAIS